jgi:hypothetical protein
VRCRVRERKQVCPAAEKRGSLISNLLTGSKKERAEVSFVGGSPLLGPEGLFIIEAAERE